MGASASGKDSIFRRLLRDHPAFRSVILYTTRPIREGEKEGISYYFVSAQELDQESAGRVIERRDYHTEYGIWSYATLDDGQIRHDGQNVYGDYLLIGTLESYLKVRDYFGRRNVMPIYLTVPDEIRFHRAMERESREQNPRYDEVKRRFEADRLDFSEEKLKHAGIERRYENLDLNRCLAQIEADLKKLGIPSRRQYGDTK